MKKRKFSKLTLNKIKVVDLNITQEISGGSGSGCDMYESVRICEEPDTTDISCACSGNLTEGINCVASLYC